MLRLDSVSLKCNAHRFYRRTLLAELDFCTERQKFWIAGDVFGQLGRIFAARALKMQHFHTFRRTGASDFYSRMFKVRNEYRLPARIQLRCREIDRAPTCCYACSRPRKYYSGWVLNAYTFGAQNVAILQGKNSKIAPVIHCQRWDLWEKLTYSHRQNLEGIQWILWYRRHPVGPRRATLVVARHVNAPEVAYCLGLLGAL